MSFGKTALAVAAALSPMTAAAQTSNPPERELAQIRQQIQQMKDEYEARIRSLEKRLQDAEAKADRAVAQSVAAGAPAGIAQSKPASGAAPAAISAASTASPATAGANAFNPAISLILGGTYANLSQDPSQYRIQGFAPGGDEIGPGARSFNLGESELTLSANIDHRYHGKATFAVTGDNEVEVEEAFVGANALVPGVNALAGRFLSSVGYLNNRHAHTWDFVDAPLAYQAFFGGQYKNDGVQLKWLAPTDRFTELGIETGRGAAFPGTDRNKNGANSFAAFAHIGDDIGTGGSWRVGLSYLRTSAVDRSFGDVDLDGVDVTNAFTGTSRMWIADAIFKWAPGGNARQTNLKLQAEYFRRTEQGTLTYDTAGSSFGPLDSDYRSEQSGWYVQGVYQFIPQWRIGARYDRLDSGALRVSTLDEGVLDPADFSRLISYNPSRTAVMVDYSPSEFSRFRVQFAQDKSRPGATDRQIFLQYIMSLGVHGAHAF